MVAIRLLQAGALDEVKTLAPSLPEDVGQSLLRTVAVRQFDKKALEQYGGDPSELPQVTNFRFGFDHVSFFLVNKEGIGSSVPVTIQIDDDLVPADKVQQFGPLFTVAIRQGKPHVRLTILANGEILGTGVYQR